MYLYAVGLTSDLVFELVGLNMALMPSIRTRGLFTHLARGSASLQHVGRVALTLTRSRPLGAAGRFVDAACNPSLRS